MSLHSNVWARIHGDLVDLRCDICLRLCLDYVSQTLLAKNVIEGHNLNQVKRFMSVKAVENWDGKHLAML